MVRIPRNDDEGYLFIVNHLFQMGKQPSFSEIARKLGYGSKRSVQLLLKRLVESERITYEDGKIGIVHNPMVSGGERTRTVPIVGTAACGPLTFAEEDIEGYVDVSTMFAKPGSTYFILRAKGISMNRAGIDDGDLVLVRKQATANNGDKVVAQVDEEATIKLFYREKDFVILKPDSTDDSIRPIFLSRDFLIHGVVVAALPNPF